MDKQVKLTLSTAIEMYKQGGASKSFALDNFTEEELTRSEVARCFSDLGHVSGFYIGGDSQIRHIPFCKSDWFSRKVFATEIQAESSLAKSQLSQLMKMVNGDWIPDWNDIKQCKFSIERVYDDIYATSRCINYVFLAFRDNDTRDLFMKTHIYLIRQYFELPLLGDDKSK